MQSVRLFASLFIYCFHRYDGEAFSTLGIESNYSHWQTYFSNYDGNPFIVGDTYGNGSVKVETLINAGTNNQAWNELADYPFGNL